MQQQQKLKMDDLKKELSKVAAEICSSYQKISSSLDYGNTTRLKKEIAGLKQQQILLLKVLEERTKQKAKSRGLVRKKNYIARKGIARMI